MMHSDNEFPNQSLMLLNHCLLGLLFSSSQRTENCGTQDVHPYNIIKIFQLPSLYIRQKTCIYIYVL